VQKLSEFYEKLDGINIAQKRLEDAKYAAKKGPDGKPLPTENIKESKKQLSNANKSVESAEQAVGQEDTTGQG
jgi:hypothetical protein